MFGLIKKLGEKPLAPAISGGAPVAGPRDLRSQLSVPLESLAMPSIVVEMERLEGQATKWQGLAAKLVSQSLPQSRSLPAHGHPAACLDEVADVGHHHGVEVDEISQEEFERHLALFSARIPA